MPPSQQQQSRPSSAAYALGTDKGYVVEREVSEQVKKPQRPQSASAARPPVKPQTQTQLLQESRPKARGDATAAPPTEWKQPPWTTKAVFKSGRNDRSLRWWGPSTNNSQEEHPMRAGQRAIWLDCWSSRRNQGPTRFLFVWQGHRCR